MTLTVATYNIAAGLSNGYFQKKNYYRSADVIKSIGADIITLNEVGKPLPAFIREHTAFIARHCKYKYYSFAKATSFGTFPYGNAVLSKYPIENIKVTPVKKFVHIAPGIYEPRCILSAEIKCENTIRVICTHLGLFPDEQKLGLSKVAEQVKMCEMPTIFMGDLNINGNKGVIKPLKSLLTDVCDSYGTSVKTFPAKKPKKRLDYIFVSDNIKIDDVHVVNEIASDHLPLVAKITI